MNLLVIVPIAGLLSVAFAAYLFYYINKQESGTQRMVEISEAIKEGARAYMRRQYMTLAAFVLVMSVLLTILLGYKVALAYIVGSLCSGLSGLFGMEIAVRANVRTTNAARKGLNKAFPIAFYGGAVMGLSVVGLALLGLSVFYYLYRDPNIVLGFSFGASVVALFAKVGGGIYTKTADIGADLVGKVEAGIPEDDPRNPAVIADNVGDNVGDVAGTGADLFDSYVGSIVAAMIIGVGSIYGMTGTILPLLLAALGIFSSIIGTLFVRGDPATALNKGTYSTCIIFAIFSYLLINLLNVDISIFYAAMAGLISGIVIGLTSDYFTSIDRGIVRNIAESAKTGAAINILTGFSYGLLSVVPPIVGICLATIAAWYFGGIYGVSIAAVGMLSITGMIVASDAYGPIADNAKGIAEQSNLGDEIVEMADRLDAVGNTAKAITKGFAIGAAALTVLALFSAYTEVIRNVGFQVNFNLTNPYVMVGVFLGACMPPLFSALTILAVGKNAFRMIEEVRRQFREIPGILEGKTKPDYAECVDIATKGALKEFILPSILSIVITLIVGFVLGTDALGGFLAGSIVTGVIFALMMANAGGAWDNAKKYIEEGNFGGKGSEAHNAAIVGDTVGDPFKDTAGPSLNTLITVISLVASLFAPIIIKYALL
jgi:K(+)-stimulated pyrophosphate-energized sodium pump